MIRNPLLAAKAGDRQTANVPLRNDVEGFGQATGIHSCITNCFRRRLT